MHPQWLVYTYLRRINGSRICWKVYRENKNTDIEIMLDTMVLDLTKIKMSIF